MYGTIFAVGITQLYGILQDKSCSQAYPMTQPLTVQQNFTHEIHVRTLQKNHCLRTMEFQAKKGIATDHI